MKLTLREHREANGYTQQQLARKSKTSVSSISKMENNKEYFMTTKYSTISKVLNILDITEDDIEWD